MEQIEGPSLTPRNALFVRFLLDGQSTVDAYRKSGYKGNPHAAYELRSKLRGYLRQGAAVRGVSADGIALDLVALDALPLKQADVSVREKLAIIAAKQKLVEMEVPPPPKKEGYTRLRVVEAEVIPTPPAPAAPALLAPTEN
jgi:hypothetical protein